MTAAVLSAAAAMGVFWENFVSGLFVVFIRACGRGSYVLLGGPIKFLLKSDKISLDGEMGNLVEL